MPQCWIIITTVNFCMQNSSQCHNEVVSNVKFQFYGHFENKFVIEFFYTATTIANKLDTAAVISR